MDDTRSAGTADGSPAAVGAVLPPPAIYLLAVGSGAVLDKWLPSWRLPVSVRVAASAMLLTSGLLLSAAFLRAFRRARTPVDLRKPTARLVIDGPYAVTRNPGYVALTLLSCGIAFSLSSLWAMVATALAVVVVDRFVVRREEAYLRRHFGGDYDRYTARVGRWV